MRRTRIQKARRSTRARPGTGDPYGFGEALDPRDPDIVRAKRLQSARRGGIHRP
ncbi:hypothetical protein AB0G67_14585 [Streptomyces sp. NPDC021056]|uniref:hypothetical protein n=1 Tax=unclassified Streptomyces TaxID=2593676 RepID=UPI0033F1F8E3